MNYERRSLEPRGMRFGLRDASLYLAQNGLITRIPS